MSINDKFSKPLRGSQLPVVERTLAEIKIGDVLFLDDGDWSEGEEYYVITRMVPDKEYTMLFLDNKPDDYYEMYHGETVAIVVDNNPPAGAGGGGGPADDAATNSQSLDLTPLFNLEGRLNSALYDLHVTGALSQAQLITLSGEVTALFNRINSAIGMPMAKITNTSPAKPVDENGSAANYDENGEPVLVDGEIEALRMMKTKTARLRDMLAWLEGFDSPTAHLRFMIALGLIEYAGFVYKLTDLGRKCAAQRTEEEIWAANHPRPTTDAESGPVTR